MQFEDLDKRGQFEHLPEAIFLEDFEGNILDVNNEACRLLGYSKEELLERKVEDIVPEEQPVFMAEEIDQATQASDPIETVNIRKDGTEIPIELRGRIIEIDGEGRILVSVRDISDRKRAKRKLKQSEERLQLALEGTKAGIWDWNVQTGDVVFNERWAEIVGYTLEELQPVSIETWEELAHPEDLNRSEELLEKHFDGETDIYECEARMKHKNGDWVWILDRGRVVEWNEQGEPVRMVGTHQDITERKEAEQELKSSEAKFSAIAEQAHDGIYIYKRDRFEWVNRRVSEILGYRREELTQKSVWDLIYPQDRDKVKKMTKKMRDGKEAPSTYEARILTKDDEVKHAEFAVTLIEYKGEQAILGAARDITERKRAQQALNEERDKLRHLHNAVDELQQQDTEDEILQTAIQVSENVLDFELCAIDLIEGDYLVTKAISSGLSPDQTHKYKIGEGIGGITAEQGETIWGDDLRNHPEAKPASNDFRAFISAPIGDVGVFQVVSLEVGSFDEEDLELAEILASHLQEEIKRVRLEEELRQQAIRDPLTDLYNRRYFNETLEEEVERCRRYDKSIAFLMADVNRFKKINDRYSHQLGDEVLKQVAELLEEKVRDADTVVSYGGDEFLVMMTQTERGVENTVKRLKEALEQWNEESDLLDFPLTLAMGASYWSPEQDRSVEEALKEADKKMYEDKER